MNKAELVSKISEKSGATKKETENFVNTFLDVVTEALVEGDKIQLVGFGTFSTKERAARVGRNPRDPKQTIEIPSAIVPIFKAGEPLKKIVNQGK